MGRRTPLYDTHIRHGARMADFAGWDMPLHYGSQLIEHRCVREQADLFLSLLHISAHTSTP